MSTASSQYRFRAIIAQVDDSFIAMKRSESHAVREHQETVRGFSLLANDDDYDVVRRCDRRRPHHERACTRHRRTPWVRTLAFGHHEDRPPTHGYEPTREAVMAAFAKSWRLER
jgi:hypothetical protein